MGEQLHTLPEMGECRFSESEALIKAVSRILFRRQLISSSQSDDLKRNPHFLSKEEARAFDVLVKSALTTLYSFSRDKRTHAHKIEIELLNRAIDALRPMRR